MLRLTSAVSASALALLVSSPAQADWSTAHLSVARTNIEVVTVEDLVLFAGGRVGNTVLDVIDVYNSTTDTWSTETLPAPKANLSAATMGHLVFFAGGVGPAFAVSDVVDILDTQSMTWSSATLSEARAIVGMTTVGNKVVVAGGGGIGWVSDVVDVYDADLGLPEDPLAWLVGSPLSVARSNTSAVTVDGLAIFAGGAGTGGTPFDTVDIYHGATDSWTTADLSVARLVGGAATVVGDRAYFVGGHFSQGGGPNMSNAVDVFDAQAAQWTSTTLPTGPRGYLAVTAVGNTLLLGGGVETGFVASNLVETYNVGTEQWGASQSLSQPARDAAAIGGMALFTGSGTTVVDIYEPVGVSFCGAETNSSGSAATMIAFGSNSVAANDLTLSADLLPPNQYGYFLNSPTQGFTANPGGSQGNLCLGGAIGRYSGDVFNSGAAGTGQLHLDLTNTPTPSGSVAIAAGETWNFQCWFRDVNPNATSNFTDAVSVTFH